MIRRLFTTLIEQPPYMPQPIDMFPASSKNTGQNFQNVALESLNWLHSMAPCFPLCGDRVQVILEPKCFYETLLNEAKTAKHRIVMASLYLGIGKLETDLVNAIHSNLKNSSDLNVQILLDYTRGSRGDTNSKSMVKSLLTDCKNFYLSLYHTPALRGLTKRLAPPRWNELLGLQHMKLYLFDDKVMISGANLSNDYFTNRQDRYLLIEDKHLANFYAEFISKVQEFSIYVNRDESETLHPSWSLMPYTADSSEFAIQARERILKYFNTVYDQQRTAFEENPSADTWIFPLIEMGQIGIHHDSLVTKKLLSSAVNGSQMNLATGYFNLTQTYMDTITVDCKAACNILMAHPNANGFQGAKGPAGGIPAAYSLIAKRFHQKLQQMGQDHRVKLYEYEKENWSYHAKGLWYYLPDSNLPILTLIGSSNYGERSVNRDLESQICLVTTNNKLQQQLQAECDNLYQLGSCAEQVLTSRPIPNWVKAVVGLFRDFF